MAIPLQLVDDFLLQYNIGQVLLFVFVVGLLATLPLRNKTVVGLHVTLFGFILLVTPLSLLTDVVYQLVGVGLLFVGPMILVVGR
jgi:hypothetical protein